MSDSSSQGGWAVFGKVSAVITVVGAVVGIIVAVAPTGPRLQATVALGEYYTAPSVDAGVNQARALLSSITSTAAGPVEDALDAARLRFTTEPRTYLTVAVVNRGKRVAEDVVLYVPGAVEASSDGSDSGEQPAVAGDRVELGNMRPESTVQVRIWTDASSYGLQENMRLAHNNGTGRLQFARPVTGFLAGVADTWDTYGWSILFFAVAGFCAIMLLIKIDWVDTHPDRRSRPRRSPGLADGT